MDNKTLLYKMILLGDTGVGKTSLFRKLTTDQFESKVISTIGIDKRTLNFNINTSDGEKLTEISLYDTAGQERFRSISISYFREAKGLVIIYDITNYESFQNIDNWISNIKDNVGNNNNNYLIILFGNKLDLVTNDKEKREVEENEVKDFCTNRNILWGGEFSAKDFTADKLKEVFIKIIEEIYKKVGNVFKNEDNSLKNYDNKNKKGCC